MIGIKLVRHQVTDHLGSVGFGDRAGRLQRRVQEALQIGLVHGGFAGCDMIQAAQFHPLLQAPQGWWI